MRSSRESVLKDVQRITSEYGFGNKWGIKVDRSPSYGGGLGLFATRDFKENEDILTTHAYAHATNQSHCDGCWLSKEDGEIDKLFKCSQCSFVCYCSRECQVKMWPIHKLECKNMSIMLKRHCAPLPGMILLTRLLYTHRANITRNGSLELINNLDDLWANDNKMGKPMEYLLNFVQATLFYTQEPRSTDGALLNYTKKIESHVTSYGEQNIMILPFLAFINHRCISNIFKVHGHSNKLEMTIVASRDIKKGEELYLDYTKLEYRKERLEKLHKYFLHKCLCSICREINDTGSKEKYYRCQDCSCNGRVDIRWKSPSLKQYHAICLKCGKEYDAEELEKKGNIIKSNIKEEFNKAPLEIKEMMIKLYTQHFHVLDFFLAEELDKDALVSLNDVFIFKRIQLQLDHHFDPCSLTSFGIVGDFYLKLELKNPDLAAYVNGFTSKTAGGLTVPPKIKQALSNPDCYFDKTLLDQPKYGGSVVRH
ncbi:hypothetical protein CYY_010064 [Polysphondylium violaceum]|uniref:SET domain-containing protein n=1 Tax=Polysphondylium violaceum TaxID=133409 RepID=A0A8J4V019_9MYCE|nr:hypothetical protein CYY_010064 [Polysphondylium violaceum]